MPDTVLNGDELKLRLRVLANNLTERELVRELVIAGLHFYTASLLSRGKYTASLKSRTQTIVKSVLEKHKC